MADPPSEKTWPPVPEYPDDLFEGTAHYYTQCRPPYPDALIADLCRRAQVSGDGRLLDLACGPGRATLPLAPHFREVRAVDLEPGMIEVGQAEAKRLGLENIRWSAGRAEDVDVPRSSIELVSIGEAFHRLDQRKIAERCQEWLAPGGHLAILWYANLWRGNEEWQTLAHEVAQRYKRSVRQANAEASGQESMNFEEVLRATGYLDVHDHTFSSSRVWPLDALVGYYYSGSQTSRRALGDKAEDFESDLRQTLLAYDSKGEYPETSTFGYILAKRA